MAFDILKEFHDFINYMTYFHHFKLSFTSIDSKYFPNNFKIRQNLTCKNEVTHFKMKNYIDLN